MGRNFQKTLAFWEFSLKAVFKLQKIRKTKLGVTSGKEHVFILRIVSLPPYIYITVPQAN